MNVLKPFNKKVSEKEIKFSEEEAAKELKTFVEELQEKYDVIVVPKVVFSAGLRMDIIARTIDVCSNKRLKK